MKTKIIVLTCAATSLLSWEIRSELHLKFQDLGDRCSDSMVIGKLEASFVLPGSWTMGMSVDLPYISLRCKKTIFIEVDEEGVVAEEHFRHKRVHPVKQVDIQKGFSDLPTKIYVTSPRDGWRVTLGSQFMFPTAQEVDIGTGKYRMQPEVKGEFPLGNWESWWECALKYEFSYAGEAWRPSIQILSICPKVNWGFSPGWLLAAGSDTQYNIEEKSWFVPLAVSLKRIFHEQLSVSIEYKTGFVRDFPVYRHDVEGVLGYSF